MFFVLLQTFDIQCFVKSAESLVYVFVVFFMMSSVHSASFMMALLLLVGEHVAVGLEGDLLL